MKSVTAKASVVSDYFQRYVQELRREVSVLGIAFVVASLGWAFTAFAYLNLHTQHQQLEAAYKMQVDAAVKGIAEKEKHSALVAQTQEFILKVRAKHGDKHFNPYVAYQWAVAYVEAAKEYKLPLQVLLGMGIVESGYSHVNEYGTTLVSRAGAEGIMQVMPRYWGRGQIPFIKSPKDLRNPILNIKAGAYVLAYYKAMYGDIRTAILVYNRGPAAVDRDLRRGLNPERNNDYAVKVLQRVEQYVSTTKGA
jgi:soluble lytic murein transglycosylase-like protein